MAIQQYGTIPLIQKETRRSTTAYAVGMSLVALTATIFVAIHTSSKTSENELVVTNRKHGQIVLGYKKLPPHASHFALSLTGPPLAKAFIDAHTAVRALHGAPPLTWDNALADSSLKYASGCVKGHATDLPADVGENLYYTASSAKINLDDPALVKSAVDKWYSEEANWDYAASAGKGTGSTGHFTQTVWKSTAKVGCGIASCPNILIGGKTWADVGYVICRYTPSGNWDGEYATNVPKKK